MMTGVMGLSPIQKRNHPTPSFDVLQRQDCHDEGFERPTLIQKQDWSIALHADPA